MRADDATAYPDHVRLTVRAVDGSATITTTVSAVHIMHIVTDSAPAIEAATAGECKCLPEECGQGQRL